jgi:uncharacterized protein YneF (UPF0154 family)
MKIGRWLALSIGIVCAAVVLGMVVAVVIGYTAYKPANPGWVGVASKTLWDWLDLLIIPFVVAVVGTVGGYYFARSENRTAQAIADKRIQDEALQAYLDQMGQMLLDKERPLRQSEKDSEERILARARTLTLLQKLDPQHKRSVLQFLSESYLIEAPPAPTWGAPEAPWARTKSPPVINLEKADLEHANLKGMYLGIIDLSKALVSHADLTRCRFGYVLVMNANLGTSKLESTELSFAKLRGAHFGGAIMQGAILRHADLTEAGLGGVDLTKADLTGADLTNAHAPGANFSEATVTERQVLTCKVLTFATMPNGQKYEEWLKDKENRGEHLTDQQKADLKLYDEYLRKLKEGENGSPS